MKNLLYVLLIIVGFTGCKKDDGPEALPEIASIVGQWKLAAHEQMVNGEKVWVPVNGEASLFSFRFDGVILDPKGFTSCCAPKGYYLNGVLFEVKPKEPVPSSPQCASVDCVGCETWSLEQTGNELILSYCAPITARSKYIRN